MSAEVKYLARQQAFAKRIVEAAWALARQTDLRKMKRKP